MENILKQKYEIPNMDIFGSDYIRVTEVSNGSMTGTDETIQEGTGGSTGW